MVKEIKAKEPKIASPPIDKSPPLGNYPIEELLNSCSFFTKDEKTNQKTYCDKPIFDKKKALCRSHNRQVRKRFNEFTKDMSISSTAAWEMQWEQSGDWRYFWNLVDKDDKK